MRIRVRRYINLIIFIIFLAFAFSIAYSVSFAAFIHTIGSLRYLGVFIAGILYVYTLTAVLGIVLLVIFSHILPLYTMSLIAAIGAMLADYSIYYFSDKIYDQVTKPLPITVHQFVKKLKKRKNISWVIIVIGLLCLMLPLPDEIGISLLGLSNMNKRTFLIFAFLLNAIGIFCLVFLIGNMHIVK